MVFEKDPAEQLKIVKIFDKWTSMARLFPPENCGLMWKKSRNPPRLFDRGYKERVKQRARDTSEYPSIP